MCEIIRHVLANTRHSVSHYVPACHGLKPRVSIKAGRVECSELSIFQVACVICGDVVTRLLGSGKFLDRQHLWLLCAVDFKPLDWIDGCQVPVSFESSSAFEQDSATVSWHMPGSGNLRQHCYTPASRISCSGCRSHTRAACKMFRHIQQNLAK